jgi:hypothetical protein
MFMLEMVLDEFSYVAFMEQDTNFLSYELGLVTESGEISEVLNCIMYELIFAKLASKQYMHLD